MSRLRPSGSRPVPRSLRSRFARLPARLRRWLRRAGRLADREGVRLYAAGGFVRDLLLGRANADLDLAVEGDAAAFAQQLKGSVRASLFVHPRFRTASVIFPDGWKIDIVTAREERYAAPAALPTVAPGPIQTDLYRRDFTINALAVALNRDAFGELIDPYGGLSDVRRRIVRVLHAGSVIDDPTRMFRAVRFAARYGFRIAVGTRRLIREAVRGGLVDRLSESRLRQEIRLLLSEPEPPKYVQLMAALGLLSTLHPDLRASRATVRLMRRLQAVLRRCDRRSRAPRRRAAGTAEAWRVYLYALIDSATDSVAGAVVRRLGLGARTERDLLAARAARGAIRKLPRHARPSKVAAAVRGLGDEALLYLMAQAPPRLSRRLDAYRAVYRYVEPKLRGRDLQALGLPPGPLYGRILERLLAARMDGTVRTKAQERMRVLAWVRGSHAARMRPRRRARRSARAPRA